MLNIQVKLLDNCSYNLRGDVFLEKAFSTLQELDNQVIDELLSVFL